MNETDENFLAKEVWWWRPGATHRPFDFNSKNSLAFNYELVKRVYRSERFVPFYALKVHHLSIIWPLSDDPLQQPVSRETYDLNRQKESGWTVPNPILQWNLKASKRALHAAFDLFIQQQRDLQNIPKPRPNAGERRKPLSWRWPELMDLADLNVCKLDDSERSKLSVARKVANQKAEKFANIIDEYYTAGQSDQYPFGQFFDEPDFDPPVTFSTLPEKPFGKGYWPRE
jgi:hypothetical protein